MKEVTAMKDKPIVNSAHPVKGKQSRFVAARISRAKARDILKKSGRHIPYILQKGKLDKISKMADKGLLVQHIQNSEDFQTKDAQERAALKAAAADTVSVILSLGPPKAGEEEDSDVVKKAKVLRADARAHLKAAGKDIPYVLRAGTLNKLMRIKDKGTVLEHISHTRAKMKKLAAKEKRDREMKAVRKQRAKARKELTKEGREIPYVLQKNTLKVMMKLHGAEKDAVMKHIEETNKEIKAVDAKRGKDRADKEAEEAFKKKHMAEMVALQAIRAKARKEFEHNGKKVPFFLVKNSLNAIENLSASEKKTIEKRMLAVEAEIRADKKHKAYSDPKAEKAAAAKVQAMKDEDEAMMAAKEVNDPSPDNRALKAALKFAKMEDKSKRVKSTGDPIKDAVHEASAASANALKGVLPKDSLASQILKKEQEKAKEPKAPLTILGCAPKEPNMKTLGAISEQLASLANEVVDVAKDPTEKLPTTAITGGTTLRRQLADVFADACRDVPMVIHGEGIDDIKQVASEAKSLFDYKKTDLTLKAKGDLKTRVQNEMKRAAKSCTAKNGHMGDSATVIECNRRVWARIQFMLAEYNQAPKKA